MTKDILFTGDKNVLKYLSVLMESILENITNKNIVFHVLYPQNDNTAVEILENLSKNYPIKYYGVDSKLVHPLSNVAGKRWPDSAFFPLFATELLPKSIDRILVLDCDTLVVDNIDELFDIDFQDKMILATSSWIKGYAEKYIPRKLNYDFNSGVYVVNLKKWREKNINLAFWKVMQSKLQAKKLTLFDQDLLNEAFSVQDTKYINKSYNVNPSKYEFAKKSDEFNGIKILHFTNNHYFEGKPWYINILLSDVDDSNNSYFYKFDSTILKMVSLWWSYAEKTEYFNEFQHDSDVIKNFYMKYALPYFKKEKKLSNQIVSLKQKIKALESLKDNSELLNYNFNSLDLSNTLTFKRAVKGEIVSFTRVLKDNNYIVIPLVRNLQIGQNYKLKLNIKANHPFKSSLFVRFNHTNKQLIDNVEITTDFKIIELTFESNSFNYKDLAITIENKVGTILYIQDIIIEKTDEKVKQFSISNGFFQEKINYESDNSNYKIVYDNKTENLLKENNIFSSLRHKQQRFKKGDIIVLGKNSVMEEFSSFEGGSNLFTMGAFSYSRSNLPVNTVVGRYSSIAPGVTRMGTSHPIKRFTTSNLTYEKNSSAFSAYFEENGQSFEDFPRVENTHKNFQPIIIGNDVWVGQGVTFSGSGIKVGNGAIIAAKAVVTKDIPPYAVVGGVPAKIIKYRFPKDIIEKLEKIQWWQYDPIQLKLNSTDVSISEFIENIETLKANKDIKTYHPKYIRAYDFKN